MEFQYISEKHKQESFQSIIGFEQVKVFLEVRQPISNLTHCVDYFVIAFYKSTGNLDTKI